MNQEELTPSQPAISSSQVTAGSLLRGYRERSGMALDSLASALHVLPAKLQALEDNRLDALPDVMFARALAMAMCRYLKSDAAAVLALMPGQDVSRLAPKNERGIDSPLHRPSYAQQSGLRFFRASSFTPMRWGAIAVLVLAAGVAFWPASRPVLNDANGPVTIAPAVQTEPAEGAQGPASGETVTLSAPAPTNASGAQNAR